MIWTEELETRHVNLASRDIRLEDRMEWLAGCGETVESRLLRSFPLHFGRVVLEDGKVLALWGTDAEGWVWLVATDLGAKRWRPIMRNSEAYITEIASALPTGVDLQCYADKRNKIHHRWLLHMGFNPEGEVFMGPRGLPFIFFRRRQS